MGSDNSQFVLIVVIIFNEKFFVDPVAKIPMLSLRIYHTIYLEMFCDKLVDRDAMLDLYIVIIRYQRVAFFLFHIALHLFFASIHVTISFKNI
jgi:hypothetical protein